MQEPTHRGSDRSSSDTPPRERRRVAFIAHCLLNQNAKVDEGAKCPAMWTPVIHLLRERAYVIRQMPCPELAFGGARRFWGVREQFDTPLYRRHCRRLATLVAAVMAQHVRAGDDVVLIGVDSSPTMGVDFTPSAPHWGGRPDRVEDDSTLVRGDGIFLEQLKAELTERGLPIPRSTGIRHWHPDYDPEEERRRLEALLAQSVRGDPRSHQVAVVPDSLLESLLPLLEKERWGVIQLPPADLDDEAADAWLEQVAEHVAEFRRSGYAVVLVDEGGGGAQLDAALAALGVPPLPRAQGSAESLSRYAVVQPPPSGAA